MSYEEGYCTCAGLPEKHVLGVKGCLRDVFGQPVRGGKKAKPATDAPPTRSKLVAGITHDAVELTDDRLVLVRAFVAALLDADRLAGVARRIDGPALAARQAGELAEPSVGPDAAELGAVLAGVACEVERATRLHGRTCPGGMGETGTAEDRRVLAGARQAKQEAIAAGEVSFRHVLKEEIAEVWAEPAGSEEQEIEAVQSAAVLTRMVLAAREARRAP